MKKMDNKGFTLIELLVAICILAIIITPLLHSFVSSYRVNAKSKSILRATTLAQNEMEIFEKEKIEDLQDPSKFDYTSTQGEGGIIEFEKLGVTNDNSGRATYDVYVKLDPLRDGVSSRYYNENTLPVVEMNTISALDSGTYIQAMRTENKSVGLDEEVYGIFYNHRDPSMASGLTIADFEKKLNRKIIVNILQTEGEDPVTKAKVTYEYTCQETGIMPAEYKTYDVETMIFDNGQVFDEDGKRVELKGIYLFFAPRFNVTNMDQIVIENEKGLPVNIYIIRQAQLLEDGTGVWEVPINYQEKLIINDHLNAQGKTEATYWTNMNIKDSPAIGVGQQLDVTLKNYEDIAAVYGRDDILEKTGMRNIGSSSAKDRIYYMTVKVFLHGEDPQTAQPIVSFDGTKLE